MNAQTRSFQRLFDFNKPSWLKRIMQHLELIAALTSGLLIAVAWYLDHQQLELASIILYLSAYIIGGYAKAKEGIQDTIENRELNVEMLMLLAAIGSAIIGYWSEGAILIFIFALSGALETYTMNKSHKKRSCRSPGCPRAIRFSSNQANVSLPTG